MRWRQLLTFVILVVVAFEACETSHGSSTGSSKPSAERTLAPVSPLLAAPDRFILGYRRDIARADEVRVVASVISKLQASLDIIDVRGVEERGGEGIAEVSEGVERKYGGVSFTRLQGRAELVVLYFKTRPAPKRFISVVSSLGTVRNVRYVEPDYYQFGAAHVSHSAASTPPPRCALGSAENSGDDAWSRIDLDSAATAVGAVIGIIDSGIYVKNGVGHVDLPKVSGGLTYEPDTYGHGTYLAGVIAAVRGNGIGVQGMAPGTKITAKQFLDAQGRGDAASAKEKIGNAIKEGAQVILLSWGTTVDSQALRDAIHDHPTVLFVAAAGNFHRKLSDAPIYPAYYSTMPSPEPNVISVAAVNIANGALTAFSNSEADVEAPGDGPIFTQRTCSTVLNDEYGRLAGTSVAAAFVAGEAALLISKEMGKATDPWKGVLTSAQVVELKHIIIDNRMNGVIDVKMALNAVR